MANWRLRRELQQKTTISRIFEFSAFLEEWAAGDADSCENPRARGLRFNVLNFFSPFRLPFTVVLSLSLSFAHARKSRYIAPQAPRAPSNEATTTIPSAAIAIRHPPTRQKRHIIIRRSRTPRTFGSCSLVTLNRELEFYFVSRLAKTFSGFSDHHQQKWRRTFHVSIMNYDHLRRTTVFHAIYLFLTVTPYPRPLKSIIYNTLHVYGMLTSNYQNVYRWSTGFLKTLQ